MNTKQRIYIHDGGNWMVKGRFEKAFDKDSKIRWDVKDNNYSLSILAGNLCDTCTSVTHLDQAIS